MARSWTAFGCDVPQASGDSWCTGAGGIAAPALDVAAAEELPAYECELFCVTTVEMACLKINCS